MRSVMRAAVVAGGVVALLAPAAAEAKTTKTVVAGVPTRETAGALQKLVADKKNDFIEVNDFFPHGVTVHVGDAVRFAPAGFHTVDLPPKAAGALPLIAPNGQIVAGANDAGGQPFWFNGFPQLGFNHALLKTGWGSKLRYNGSKRITSGLPLGPVKPMTVTFKKAGRFTYYCNIHPGMKGRVTVKPKAKAIPSAAADAGRLKRQIGRDLRLAKGLKRTTAPAATVDVGVNATHGVTYYQMFPRTLEVKPGTTVLFRVPSGHTDVHTATFGPPAYVQPIAKSFQGAPVFDARGVYPSEPPTASLASLTPTLHGNGFWNSGVLDRARATPLPASQAVTFSQAGTYRFQCVIHPNMQGTIVVK